MIIIDLSQVMIANVMMHIGKSGGTIELPMFKHMVLNSLRSYKQKYSAKYGEMIIAADTGSSWRKSVFPYYKANRQTDKDESDIDWNTIFEGITEIKSDLATYFPYRIIQVEGAEADDVIGALCSEFGSDGDINFGNTPNILILSGDKDFRQLQRFSNVTQYDPTRNKFLNENSPHDYLIEHTIKGDKSDGIPNILSADNSLVIKERQGTLSAKRMAAFTESAKTGKWDDSTVARNYARNKQLIDLFYTPEPLRADIIDAYHDQEGKTKDQLFNYFMKNRMKNLMEAIGDF